MALRLKNMATAILIILDGLGVGKAPDAEKYGDVGSDTLGNMSRQVGGLNVPTLQQLGLGNLSEIKGVPAIQSPMGDYGRLQEISEGKDSTTGHWELMGVHTEVAFPTYPNGFPEAVLAEFTEKTGYGVIGNKAASGTAIIKELGDEHVASKKLIVYTSADSVFQIAAHDSICDKEELYRVCEIARELLKPPHNVSRVIARPFAGESGNYSRTPYRHDYSLDPPASMILPNLQNHGVHIQSIGKIYDLYCGFGIAQSHTSLNNQQGMDNLEAIYSQLVKNNGNDKNLVLLNLVDFDMLWGHRNDPQGMKDGLETFDLWLGSFIKSLRSDDLLLMTADHGNDPTTPTTDHSREHVPIIGYRGGQLQ
ncbi:MAG: phosphopentomutase, partial [Kangiellaceae bacterium]|nr:phosphopentomutase [Kangiellaceae bacterium]